MLVDAGPLVAMLDRSDRYHEICVETFRFLNEPMATVWPAITEAMYLLGFSWTAQEALWRILERGSLSILSLDSSDTSRMRELMERYRDLPMDLADAALVRVAEREGISRVFTLDRRDFLVYRPEGLGSFSVIPEI